MLKIFTNKEKLKFSSELLILGGLLSKLPQEQLHSYNVKGESRFGNLIKFCNDNINYIDDPSQADVFVLPYKFNGKGDRILKQMTGLSKKFGKELWCFYNDDDETKIILPSHVKLFRTSYNSVDFGKNDICMPPLATDHFEGGFIDRLNVGFVGHDKCDRKKFLSQLSKCSLETNFIIRSGFWAPGIEKQKAIAEYFDNMKHNLFIVCYRGGGNFSYRFYETLMMGRIPIFISDNSPLPFKNQIDYSKHCVMIEKDEIQSFDYIANKVTKFYQDNKENIKEIQNSNRKLWEDYFSAVGFVDKLIKTYGPTRD